MKTDQDAEAIWTAFARVDDSIREWKARAEAAEANVSALQARVGVLEGALTAARDVLRKVSLERRAIGPIATLAQQAAWEASQALTEQPTEQQDQETSSANVAQTSQAGRAPEVRAAVSLEEVEMVDWSSGYQERADSIWRVTVDGYCADFQTETAATNFRNAIIQLIHGGTEGRASEAGDAA
jgi:hypothetical protein